MQELIKSLFPCLVFEEKANGDGKNSNPVSRSTSNSSDRMKSTSTNTTYAEQPTTSRSIVTTEEGAQNFGFVCHSIKDIDIVEESAENVNNRDDDNEEKDQFSQFKRIIEMSSQFKNENKLNQNHIELTDIPA